MKIINSIRINKPVDHVWKILGDGFADIHRWSSDLIHSEGMGQRLSGDVCENRACKVKGMGEIKERITLFDPVQHVLTYEVTEGFPFFVKRGVNNWGLEKSGETTVLHMVAELQTGGIIGALMAPMMKMKMKPMMFRLAEDLKHYAETGYPHPRKQKARH